MRNIAIALCLAVLATTAAALPPPQPPSISSIVPRSGKTGTVITINGQLFLPYGGGPCDTPDCGVTVSFGDVVVKADEVAYDHIVVRVPYSEFAGPNDITVRTPRGVAFAKNGFRISDEAFDSEWAPVLVPLWLDAPVAGARGSRWSTELWLRNAGSDALTIIPWDCRSEPINCFATRTLDVSESLRNLPVGPPRATNFGTDDAPIPPARVLYVTRDGAPSLDAHLTLRELSKNSEIQIPIVREGQTRDIVDIVGVPVVSNARTTLRIYTVNDTYEVFEVYVFQQREGLDDSVAMAGTTVIVRAPFTQSGATTAYPGYAELDLGPLLRGATGSVHIAIALVPVFRNFYSRQCWAMVSITDNDTQRVTLVTP